MVQFNMLFSEGNDFHIADRYFKYQVVLVPRRWLVRGASPGAGSGAGPVWGLVLGTTCDCLPPLERGDQELSNDIKFIIKEVFFFCLHSRKCS